jgi:hypothetical protein
MTTTINLPFNSTVINPDTNEISNSTGLAINNNSSMSIYPITIEDAELVSITPEITISPRKHIPLASSTLSNIAISTEVQNILDAHLPASIDFDVGGTLVTLDIGTTVEFNNVGLTTPPAVNPTVSPFITGLNDNSVITIGSYLYSVGGNNGSLITDVYRATVNTDGSLSSWININNPLPVASSGGYLVVAGPYLYYLATGTTSIYMCTINSDNTIGSWSVSSLTIPAGVTQVVASNSLVYMLNYNSSGYASYGAAIYYFSITSTGLIANIPYTQLTISFTLAINNLPVIYNNNIYCFTDTAIYIASLDSTGTVANITQSSVSLPSNPTISAGFVANGIMYIYSWYVGSSVPAVINTAVINNNNVLTGIISSQYSVSNYNYVRNAPVLVIGTNIYLFGGNSYNEILTFPINFSSLIPSTPFTALPTAFYITSNINTTGLIDVPYSSNALSPIALSSVAYSSGSYTYTYKPIDNSSTGATVYLSVNGLLDGDVINDINITVTGGLTGGASGIALVGSYTPYTQKILSGVPSGYWPLDELSGTVANDRSGNALNGTYNGGFTLGETSIPAGGLSTLLNGTTGYVQLPTLDNTPGNIFTISGWFNTANIGAQQNIFTIGTTAANAGASLFIGADGYIQSLITGGTNILGASIATASWYYAAFVCDGTTLSLYLNGVLQATATASTTPNIPAIGINQLGADSGGSFFDGYLAQCAYYNTALTAAELLAIYNAGIIPTSL